MTDLIWQSKILRFSVSDLEYKALISNKVEAFTDPSNSSSLSDKIIDLLKDRIISRKASQIQYEFLK